MTPPAGLQAEDPHRGSDLEARTAAGLHKLSEDGLLLVRQSITLLFNVRCNAMSTPAQTFTVLAMYTEAAQLWQGRQPCCHVTHWPRNRVQVED